MKPNWGIFALWTAIVIGVSAILTAIIDTSAAPDVTSGIGWITGPILGAAHDLHPFAIFFAIMLVGMVIVGSIFWSSSRSRTRQLR